MNDVNILFGAEDRVSPKVRKMRGELDGLKRSADSAGKSIAHTGQALGRVGGAAGGVLGRATGGFSQGLGAGAGGVAAAGVGLAVTMLQASSERAMEAARSRTQWRQQAEAMQEQAREQVRQRQAGGASYIDVMRRLIGGGMSMDDVRGGLKQATAYGLTSEEGLAAIEAAQQIPQAVDQKTRDTYQLDPNGPQMSDEQLAAFQRKRRQDEVMLAMGTGVFKDASSAAAAVLANNGVANAVAAETGSTYDEAWARIDRSRDNPAFQQIRRAAVAENRVAESQVEDLVTGRTAAVKEQNAAEQMDPLAKLAGAAGREAQRTMEILQAAAKSQGTLAGVLAEMGRVVGMGNGSAARAVTDFANTVNAE